MKVPENQVFLVFSGDGGKNGYVGQKWVNPLMPGGNKKVTHT